MTLPSLKLDDRTYADLVAEASELIPSLYPQWTDHNPADPGVTLLELLAWLVEMLIYRVDRLPTAHYVAFLKLLNGPDWQPGPDIEEDLCKAVTELRRRYRAVTTADYEALACEASDQVARAQCIPRRNLKAASAAGREEEAQKEEGHVSVIVIPDPNRSAATATASEPPVPSEDLLQTVWGYLEPRRLLTTRHHVVGPTYAPIKAKIVVTPRTDALEEVLRERIQKALRGFLDPLTGGPGGNGWPFGRDVYLSELYELVDRVPGVDYVCKITLVGNQCPEGIPCYEEAKLLLHDNSQSIGLELKDHQLPWLVEEPEIVIEEGELAEVRTKSSASVRETS